jgi:hypothetical protein
MPTPNSHLHLYLSKAAVNAITCPQAFLDAYPIVKEPEVSDADTGEIITPSVYYTEADDALTIKEAIELAGELDWYDGTVQAADEASATHLHFQLTNPTGTLLMTFAGVFQAYSTQTQTPLDPDVAIQSRDDWARFIA